MRDSGLVAATWPALTPISFVLAAKHTPTVQENPNVKEDLDTTREGGLCGGPCAGANATGFRLLAAHTASH